MFTESARSRQMSNMESKRARTTTRDYVHFLTIALGSASEARYLLDVSHRLGYVQAHSHTSLQLKCSELVKGLQKMVTTLSRGEG